MNIFILVSPWTWVTESKPIHLNPQCNIKASILIDGTFFCCDRTRLQSQISWRICQKHKDIYDGL